MAKQNKGGRPTVVTPEIVNQLKFAFSKGCSITEACLYAKISRQVFYMYCDRNPGFIDDCNELRDSPMLKARMNIATSIENGDLKTSMWYAERKNKAEFAQVVVPAQVEGGIQFVVKKEDENL